MAKETCAGSRCSRVPEDETEPARRQDGETAKTNSPLPPPASRLPPKKKPRDPSLPPRITRGGDKRGRKRQSLSPNRELRGMQSERAPDYLVIGQVVCDIQPDGSGVLGGTALYSALTAARLGARVGVLTRGRYGERIDGIDVPSLEPFSDQLTIITQDAETPTFFVNEYLGSRRTQTICPMTR